jgi:hypothetical protein
MVPVRRRLLNAQIFHRCGVSVWFDQDGSGKGVASVPLGRPAAGSGWGGGF